jgi:hypothetical protein
MGEKPVGVGGRVSEGGIMTTEITVEIIRESDRAILVSDGDVQEWLPKSQCEYEGEVGQTVVVSMPEWLATDKGLI